MQFVTGIFQGVKREPGKEGKADRIWFGFANDKRNGFEGEQEIRMVKITADQVKEGILDNVFQLKGKMCMCQVWLSTNVFNGKLYMDYMCEKPPEEFHGFVVPAKAAPGKPDLKAAGNA